MEVLEIPVETPDGLEHTDQTESVESTGCGPAPTILPEASGVAVNPCRGHAEGPEAA